MTLISAVKIWDAAPHAAFTDLIRFNGRWFCTFRESDSHAGGENGTIRLIVSSDGELWETATVFKEEGIDLRDPKLSITPDNRLMLLAGGTTCDEEGEYITSRSRVAFSADGILWSPFKMVITPHEWLWSVTWHEATAYGVAYRSQHLPQGQEDWIATLYKSRDGIHFDQVTRLKVPSRPSEAVIRFQDTGEMILLIRRGGYPEGGNAWIGRCLPPYTDWSWSDSGTHFGGPNFLILPSGEMWASGRILDGIPDINLTEKTVLAKMTTSSLTPELDLPSGGDDTSYPGMVFHYGLLWISYYSSHEGKTAIYLAKVKLP